jgi:hypothetical protein
VNTEGRHLVAARAEERGVQQSCISLEFVDGHVFPAVVCYSLLDDSGIAGAREEGGYTQLQAIMTTATTRSVVQPAAMVGL